ncbi:MAG TPA: hypothetical protein VG452_06860 [Egibacteraceae bacterium]|nr:hypothetical protein [Egibacteraceae bacterium]
MRTPGPAVDTTDVPAAEPDDVAGTLRRAVDALAGVAAGRLEDAALGALLVVVHRQRERLEGIASRLVAEHDRRLDWRRAAG